MQIRSGFKMYIVLIRFPITLVIVFCSWGLYIFLNRKLNPRRHKVKKKKIHEGIRGGGGGESDPSPLLFTPFIN